MLARVLYVRVGFRRGRQATLKWVDLLMYFCCETRIWNYGM